TVPSATPTWPLKSRPGEVLMVRTCLVVFRKRFVSFPVIFAPVPGMRTGNPVPTPLVSTTPPPGALKLSVNMDALAEITDKNPLRSTPRAHRSASRPRLAAPSLTPEGHDLGKASWVLEHAASRGRLALRCWNICSWGCLIG